MLTFPLKSASACCWTSRPRAAPTIACCAVSGRPTSRFQPRWRTSTCRPGVALGGLRCCNWPKVSGSATHLNLLILGATGAGKTFLACSLGRAACQAGYNVRYERTSRLLQSLELAHADGSYPQLLRTLARTPLLICDDWLRDPLSRSQARDLLEILDDRYGRSATVVVTQVPVAEWHSRVPDPTLSDAILDRLIHNAYRLELEGESMRKVHSPLHTNDI
jgi:DNA replication protein DnaC